MSYDRRGKKNPRWRGGRVKGPDGRALIYCPGHPMANVCGGVYALEYRLVMAKKLGRNLRRGEIVHHINGDRHDNRPENLELMTQARHAKEHLRQDPKTGRFVGHTKGEK